MKKTFFLISMLSLNFISAQTGTTCQNPIIIASLPYTTTDNTANYADIYDPVPDAPNQPTCSNGGMSTYGNYYHSGNDVIYSYTPTVSGTIKIEIPNAVAWTGMFIYTSCNNIGVNYAGCAGKVSDGVVTIDNFSVTAGQTYYILISSWTTPQTVAYTLNITNLTTSNLAVSDNKIQKKEVGIYPNPAGKELHFKSPENIISASIYNMEGKKIETFKVSNNVISVESLVTGNYIVEFTNKSGSSSTKIFIKK